MSQESLTLATRIIVFIFLPTIICYTSLTIINFFVLKSSKFGKIYIPISTLIGMVLYVIHFVYPISYILLFLQTAWLPLVFLLLNFTFVFPLVLKRKRVLQKTHIIWALIIINVLSSCLVFTAVHSHIGGEIIENAQREKDLANRITVRENIIDTDPYLKSALPAYIPANITSSGEESTGNYNESPSYYRYYECNNDPMQNLALTTSTENSYYAYWKNHMDRQKKEGSYSLPLYSDTKPVYREILSKTGTPIVMAISDGAYGRYTRIGAISPTQNGKYYTQIDASIFCFIGFNPEKKTIISENMINNALLEVERIISSYPQP